MKVIAFLAALAGLVALAGQASALGIAFFRMDLAALAPTALLVAVLGLFAFVLSRRRA